MDKSKFECALGAHEYEIPDKKYSNVLICKHCKRFGHYKSNTGFERWVEYDNKGNMIYWKDNYGGEFWLHKGKWVYEKPIDWEHENI